MIDRKLLLTILFILSIISIIGYITSFRTGIDFEGGLIITITSDSKLYIPFSHNFKSLEGIYIYEIPLRLSPNLKTIIETRSELLNCLRQTIDLDKCNDYVKTMAELSGIEYENQSLIEYSNLVYESSVNKTLTSILQSIDGKYEYSYNLITPILSKELFTRIFMVFLLGMLFATIYIFLTFKTWFPTVNILSGALIDALVTIGIISLLGFDIDLSILIGLLMLFGYSLDTSVLLVSNYYLTRKPNSIDESMKTGISMITSSMLVFFIILGIGVLLNISFLKNIAAVMIIGLIVDFFTSWGYNAYLLQKYGEKYVQ